MIPSATNSFYNSFLSSVEEESRHNGYSLIIMQSADDPEVEKSILKLYRQNRVAGIFACISPGTKDLEAYKKLDNLDIPVVFFDKVPDTDSYKVSVDDESAAEIAVSELLQKNKKHILGIFGNKNFSITKNRLNTFKKALQERSDVKFDFEFANNSQDAYQSCKQYFSEINKPDAIFCMSDEILTGSMKALQQLKISYPADAGIITISDGNLPNLYYPEITFVETSGFKLGKKAFECMMSRIKNNPTQKDNLVEPVLFKGASL
jgi:LacI family transcriptional regulator